MKIITLYNMKEISKEELFKLYNKDDMYGIIIKDDIYYLYLIEEFELEKFYNINRYFIIDTLSSLFSYNIKSDAIIYI